MSDFAKDNHPSYYLPKKSKFPPLGPRKEVPYTEPSVYTNGIAAIRAAEKYAHELDMIKTLLTTVLNNLDLQQRAIDEIYDMLDCYIASGEDE